MSLTEYFVFLCPYVSTYAYVLDMILWFLTYLLNFGRARLIAIRSWFITQNVKKNLQSQIFMIIGKQIEGSFNNHQTFKWIHFDGNV